MASTTLPADAMSVATARQLVHHVSSHLPRHARDAAELVASELATNSVTHARTPFEVFAAADDEAVEIVVADGAGWTPTRPRADGGGGHGLLLVGLLASDWAAEIEGPGKRVWARVCADDIPVW